MGICQIFSCPCLKSLTKLYTNKSSLPSKQKMKKYSNIEDPQLTGQRSIHEMSLSQTMDNYVDLENAQIFQGSSEIKGVVLQVTNCMKCAIVLLKNFQTVYIDGCNDCFIFAGPTHSTVFVRNCQNMRVRAISQQLRIENTQNITIEAVVGVRPVLEECTNVKFIAMNCMGYRTLLTQIQISKIDLFRNQVYQCYDFTPKKMQNFVNVSEDEFEEQEKYWEKVINQHKESKLKQNQLFYLPRMLAVKNSMISEMEENCNDITVIYGKALLKNLLIQLTKMDRSNVKGQKKNSIQIVRRLNSEMCVKILKKQKKQKLKIVSQESNEGEWYFLAIKTDKKLKNTEKLKIIQEQLLAWKLFKRCLD